MDRNLVNLIVGAMGFGWFGSLIIEAVGIYWAHGGSDAGIFVLFIYMGVCPLGAAIFLGFNAIYEAGRCAKSRKP
jgi:hypothetical protein